MSMLCSPEKAMGAHPVVWLIALPTEISESPPPVPWSNFRRFPLNEMLPSAFLISLMNQKSLPTPVGAETYAAYVASIELRMLGSAPPPARASGGVKATLDGGVLVVPPPPEGLAAMAFEGMARPTRRVRAATSATCTRTR